jgi:DNA-binding LacI/PurR family transcriptional regulator
MVGPGGVTSTLRDAMARVTLQTIADRLGVSRMTVSNAFSRPDQLSVELRLKILATAADLGYVGPDPAGRALARGTAGAVGVLLTDQLQYAFVDEVATSFLAAVVTELAPTGLALTLLTSNSRDDVIPARDVALDGAVVYSCNPESRDRDWLVRRKLPLVYVDQDPVPDIPSVNVDDRGGARAAAQHLLDLGHRRIGIVTVDIGGHPQRQRLLGWRDALGTAGVEPVVVRAPYNGDDEADAAARDLLDRADPPTGVLCFSDVLALGVVRVAGERGQSVPRHVSVVGFDDSPLAHRNRPTITTVHQDIAGKGQAAAVALVRAIEQARTGEPADATHVLLPTELVVRESAGPVSGPGAARG